MSRTIILFQNAKHYFCRVSILLVLFELFDARTATADIGVTPAEFGVLQTISDYETGGPDILTPIFQEIGYTPKSPSVWKAFPAIRKLEELYRSAEAGARAPWARAGTRAIAVVADKLSKNYDSIRNSASINAFLRWEDITHPIPFSERATPTLSRAAPEAHSVIKKLAPVAEGKMGGLFRILTADFGLESGRAYAIVATSDSAANGLARGLSEVPEKQHQRRMIQLINRAESAHPSIAKEEPIVEYKRLIAEIEDGGGGGLDPNDLVMCLCGGRPIGIVPMALCIPNTPC